MTFFQNLLQVNSMFVTINEVTENGSFTILVSYFILTGNQSWKTWTGYKCRPARRGHQTSRKWTVSCKENAWLETLGTPRAGAATGTVEVAYVEDSSQCCSRSL